MLRCHIGGDCHRTAFFNALKTEIKGGFVSPVDSRDHPDAFRCPVGPAPPVAEHIVKLHHRRHFQIHAEIRGKYRPVSGQLFQVAFRILPNPFKAIVVQKEVYHAIKMILILQMGFVKPNEEQIIEVAGLFLKLGDNGYLQVSYSGELVAEQCLTGAVIVVFFCHVKPPVCSKE